MSYAKAHQRMTSEEEDFNNQVDSVTCFVNTSQPPFPATLPLTSGLMNKVAIVAGMVVMYGLSNMDFHYPRLPWP